MNRTEKKYTEKKYIVTGGAGFIGSHLSEALLNAGHTVVVIDNFHDFYPAPIKQENIRTLIQAPNFYLEEIDISNKAAMHRFFENYVGPDDIFIHLAARAGVRPSIEDSEGYFENNVTATFNIIELCKQYNLKRFIFASSSSVYGERGEAGHTVAFKETDDVSKPASPYAATKVMCENLLYNYAFLYGIQTVALRFFTVYGPRQRPDLAIHKFAKLIDAGEPITIFGDGSARRDFTYSEDIVQGILKAIAFQDFSTDVPFEVFNLGESNTITVNTLVTLLENAMQKKAQINYAPRNPADVTLTFADISKARALLGYDPTTPVEQGLEAFVAWFKTQQKQKEVAV
ncbi:MAG: NAD-dependent epimerase/dehydratase family protein [Cyanobacteria bacterium P01_H01_bin.74]